MILDRLENAKQYAGIAPGIDKVLAAVAAYTPENYQTGKVELDGDNVFILRNAYTTGKKEGALMEAHRSYVDVMYMVEGEEMIYVKPTACLQNITMAYDPAQDALLATLDADTTAVRLQAGSFVVLFPQDAHAPAREVDGPANVKKIIGKVRVAP